MTTTPAYRRYKSTALPAIPRCAWVILGALCVLASPGAQARAIKIVSGTYGTNCGAPRGNATHDLARQCDGLQTCRYVLREAITGVRSMSCHKDFRAEWRCTDTEFHSAALGPEAGPDSTLVLGCIEETGPGK
ncbi:hypothetical protein SAMN05192564_111102 [Paraburkholderia sartisoli]|uniref:CVNH domain-containing protein n=1 Tax=Paraburkholderia sartisoli TaxID=83784 RepID=A0A1H4HNQ1_9BURK|nr:hypothetical protein SAMN05192564_111102 [Paraburkholderia sartisoli]